MTRVGMSRVEGRDQVRSASEGQAALPLTDGLSCVSNAFVPQSRILFDSRWPLHARPA